MIFYIRINVSWNNFQFSAAKAVSIGDAGVHKLADLSYLMEIQAIF